MTFDDATSSLMDKPIDLGFQLMTDWWMSTFQALVDAAGNDRASVLIAPYHKNSGTAAAFILKESFHLGEIDRFSLSLMNKVAMDLFTRSNGFMLDIKAGGSIGRIADCPFRNGLPGLCEAVCGKMPQHYIDAFGLPIDTILTSALSRGDPECQWISRIRDEKTSGDVDDLGETIANPLPVRFKQETIDDFSLQYIAEFWVMSTRALIDHLGEDRATALLRPYFNHSGLSFGIRAKRSIKEMNTENELLEWVQNIYKVLGIKGETVKLGDAASGMSIENCPFKDAPVCICSQLSAFCSGVCEAIDPNYEFSYQRMMTKGDANCQWTISIKGRIIPDQPTKELDEGEMLKKLKWRLTNGEITIEQYRQLKDVLLEK